MKKKKNNTKNNISFGWTPSKLDGSEHQFDEIKNYDIPKKYSYVNFLPPVENQGSTNMCVTYSISAHLDWNFNIDSATKDSKSINVDKKEIYEARSIPGDNGMTFKEALNFLKKHGVKSDKGNIKIEAYAMIKTELALKQALLLNGPCIGGLYVKNPIGVEFWNGNENHGGHAIAIVGYNEEGFIIRNSWGPSYGASGYAIVKYKDFYKILECWTIID